MAKLTGKKKAEFLKRMARGRKKVARANPKRKATTKRKTAAKRKPAKKNTGRKKLTGAKKAEFLRRMARGRKKAAGKNPKRKAKKKATRKTARTASRKTTRKTSAHRKTAAKKRNPPRKRRRNSNGAEEMYETFHGKAPGRTLSYEEEVNYPAHFAELGKLLELRIDLDSANRKFPFTSFGDCLVVCTPDGENIYFIGGDQSVNLANLEIGGSKDTIELGPCVYIAYRTEKHQFHDFSPRPYYHEFGEENGIKPMLTYDRLNRKLYLASGDYHVKREGITN